MLTLRSSLTFVPRESLKQNVRLCGSFFLCCVEWRRTSANLSGMQLFHVKITATFAWACQREFIIIAFMRRTPARFPLVAVTDSFVVRREETSWRLRLLPTASWTWAAALNCDKFGAALSWRCQQSVCNLLQTHNDKSRPHCFYVYSRTVFPRILQRNICSNVKVYLQQL